MTCQWCKRYRRRDGRAACVCADGKVRVIPARVSAGTCARFDPRRTCTTCGHGCSQDDKFRRASSSDCVCPDWELRSLSSWGGNRRRPAALHVESNKTNVQTKEIKQ